MATPSRHDAVLDEVTRRLVEACHPDKIYLFGSAARGEAGPDSDYDIMIVVPDDAPEDVLNSRRAYDAVRDLKLFADLTVYRRRFFDERRHLRASMPGTILREGRLLYRREEDSDLPADPKARAKDTTAWLREYVDDEQAAALLLSASPPQVRRALFHCQQAAEKALKAFLVWHDQPFPKTHELAELGKLCVALDATLAQVTDAAKSLSVYAYRFRYPGATYEPDPEEGQRALDIARQVYLGVASRLPAEVRP